MTLMGKAMSLRQTQSRLVRTQMATLTVKGRRLGTSHIWSEANMWSRKERRTFRLEESSLSTRRKTQHAKQLNLSTNTSQLKKIVTRVKLRKKSSLVWSLKSMIRKSLSTNVSVRSKASSKVRTIQVTSCMQDILKCKMSMKTSFSQCRLSMTWRARISLNPMFYQKLRKEQTMC